MKAGETLQLVATATLSDGRTATSGFEVRWSSADEKIASVNGSGLVTAYRDGSVVITATSGTIAASSTIRIRPGVFKMTGVVTQTGPNDGQLVIGARVTVVDGAYEGVTGFTDYSGKFSLSNVLGVVRLRVSRQYFQDAEVTADAASPVAIRLTPAGSVIVDTAGWQEALGDERVFQGQFTFVQRRTGFAHVWVAGSVYYSDSASMCGELRDEDNRLIWNHCEPWNFPKEATLTLDGGKRYTLRIYDGQRRSDATVDSYVLGAEHM